MLRTLLLVLVGVGALGLLVELALLEHWTAAPQFVPLATLTLVLAATSALAVRPGRTTVRLFGAVMIVAVVAGLTGIGFHLFDNWAFEREIAPEASAAAILVPVLTGATPLLAPGSLVQLGLTGLVAIYRHPALSSPSSSSPPSPPSPPSPSSPSPSSPSLAETGDPFDIEDDT